MFPRVIKKRIFTILFIAIVALLFWYSATLHNTLIDAASALKGYSENNPAAAIIIFIILAISSAMFSLFSSVPLIPIAVTIWGNTATFIILFWGWLIGGIAAYAIGRYAGYPLVKKILPEDKISYYRNRISPQSELAIIFLFRFVTPAEITGYLLGLMRYNLGKYALITFFSELPVAALATYLGEAFLLGRAMIFWGLGVFIIILLFFLSYLFHKKKIDDR